MASNPHKHFNHTLSKSPTMREHAGTQWKEQDVVFSNNFGGYMYVSVLSQNFKGLLQETKLPNIRSHDLRHTTASLLAKLKVHLKIVQEVLGHSSISMTVGNVLLPLKHLCPRSASAGA